MELSPRGSNRMPSGPGGGTTREQSLWEGTRMSLSPFTVLSAFAITFYGKKKKKPRHIFPKYAPHFPSALLPTEAMTPSTTTWLAWSCSAGALVILQTPSDTQTSDRAPGAAESTVRARVPSWVSRPGHQTAHPSQQLLLRTDLPFRIQVTGSSWQLLTQYSEGTW